MASDLDGTLLGLDDVVSNRTRAAINAVDETTLSHVEDGVAAGTLL